ncbi:MAG TPA: S8 family serine peptidase [Anaerolineaceae bacterium]|nr:S8 family serine peptidase [Anaerolineaceae bacterium]HQH85109.1 S8 family serine peptidase [Anaerolineaceae bacterium]
MKSHLFRLFALLALIAMIVAPVSAQTPVPPTTKAAVESAVPEGEPFPYIVLFEGDSLTARYGAAVREVENQSYLNTLATQRTAILTEASKVLGHDLEVIHVYDVILNGVAVNLTPAEAAKLEALPGVRRVLRDTIETLATDTGPTLIGAPDLWAGTGTPDGIGTLGEGLIAGIIDSGINFDHPSFSETPADGYVYTWTGDYLGVCAPAGDPAYASACNDKVVGAYSYTKDAASETNTPEDSDGHGSHTASTVAGNTVDMEYEGIPTTISGVAPHAQIIAYDVCYPTPSGGQCAGNDSLAAIQQAIVDGVDVINYSISGGSDPYSDGVELAYLEAFNAGIYVSASGGNSGPAAATVAHLSPWLMTTGASTHGRVFSLPVNITGPGVVPPELTNIDAAPSSSPVAFDVTNAPLKYDPANVTGCTAFAGGYFTGSVALIQRGGCTFAVKLANAQTAGAIGMLAFNNAGGPPIAMGGLDAATLPAAMISLDRGLLVAAWLDTNPTTTTVTVLPDPAAIVNPDYEDIMASFSSQGPTTAFDVVKPDVTAPGVSILAAVADDTIAPDGLDEYDLYQGTSMSSPHNAGSGALMKALHPDWSPAEIKSAIMLTSYDDTVLAPDGVTPAGPFNMGSGRIQLEMAGLTGLVMDETYANFLAADPAEGGDVRTLNIASLYNSACVVNCSWERTFTSVAETTATYTATVDAPAGLVVTVTPAEFTIAAGATQTVTITANVEALPLDAFAFATINFDTDDAHPGGGTPSVVFSQDFTDATFPPTDWTVYDVDAVGASALWLRDTVQYSSTPASAKHQYGCSADQEGWLVTPQISIPAGITSFNFQQRGDYVGNTFYHGVWVSTASNAIADFVEIAQPADAPEDAWTTTPVSVDLTAYAGQDVYVAFKYMGNCADTWWVDDIQVLNLAAGEPISDVHMPMVVMPATSALPELITIEADANTGSEVLADNFSGLEITDFTATIDGLALGMYEEQVVLEDSTPANAYDGNGTYFVTIDVPAGARRLVAHVVESTSGDVDMFVGTGSTPSAGTVVCTSATGAVLEYCNVLDPAAGTYWILVQNFAQTEPEGDVIALSYAAVPGGDAGNMTVTADPDVVPVGTPYDLTIAWDEATMNGFDYWYAIFDAGTDATNFDNLGTVMVDLYRLPDEAELAVDPAMLDAVQGPDTLTTQTLNVNNLGDLEDNFMITEGTVTLVTEGFEGGAIPPTNWLTFHNGATTRLWAVTNNVTYVIEGTYSAWINYDSAAASDEWLLTPAMDVTDVTDLSLSFWARSDTEYPTATMKVWVTDNAGVPLTAEPLWDMVRDEEWSTWDLREIVVDLSDFDNHADPIRVAWQYVGLDGESYGMDSIAITGAVDVPWISEDPAAGTVAGDGSTPVEVTFDSTGLAEGVYTATLTVTGDNNSVDVPVTLTVEVPATAVDDAYAMDEDMVLTVDAANGVLANDTEPEGDPLTAVLVEGPLHGQLALAADGSFVYTPDADYFGTDTFTYVANDGTVDSNIATVTITIADVAETQYIYLPVILK